MIIIFDKKKKLKLKESEKPLLWNKSCEVIKHKYVKWTLKVYVFKLL